MWCGRGEGALVVYGVLGCETQLSHNEPKAHLRKAYRQHIICTGPLKDLQQLWTITNQIVLREKRQFRHAQCST